MVIQLPSLASSATPASGSTAVNHRHGHDKNPADVGAAASGSTESLFSDLLSSAEQVIGATPIGAAAGSAASLALTLGKAAIASSR